MLQLLVDIITVVVKALHRPRMDYNITSSIRADSHVKTKNSRLKLHCWYLI